jgi:hypothetical protein
LPFLKEKDLSALLIIRIRIPLILLSVLLTDLFSCCLHAKRHPSQIDSEKECLEGF